MDTAHIINRSDFCQLCQQCMLDAERDMRCCTHGNYTGECCDHLLATFVHLQRNAAAAHHAVIARFARAMVRFVRHLRERDSDELSVSETEILQQGIALGLQCDGGDPARCPAMDFDHTWAFIRRVEDALATFTD